MKKISLHVLETPQDLQKVEDLQLAVWPGTEADIVPAHLMLAAVHNGGLLIGAYEADDISLAQAGEASGEATIASSSPPPGSELVGFVFGFPGIYHTPDGPRLKHHSHMMGVLPGHRDQGIGFILKRAQWQMIRHQGLDRITWTYDPLLSRNAHLNITRLGAVCSTYLPDYYGEMRDEMNLGLKSDRFQVDWWVNSRRVSHRLSKRPRRPLDLAHYLAADVEILNPSQMGNNLLPIPAENPILSKQLEKFSSSGPALLLLEIPADYLRLKEIDLALAHAWRIHTRSLLIKLFEIGYLVTDFVHLSGSTPRSFYVLSHGESTL